MRRFFALTTLACGALAALNAAAGPVVESIRLHDYGAKTRVVLDLSQPVPPYELGTLTGPDRVMIDLAAAVLDGKFGNMPSGTGVVSAIRSSEKPGGGLRVVLDLKGAVRIDEFVLPASAGQPNRLVIDLHSNRSASKPVLTAKSNNAPLRDIVIAIDAGHGGRDPGAIGKGKTREKDVTLAIGKKLAAMVNQEPGMKAVLIRDGDYQLDSRSRVDDLRSRMEKRANTRPTYLFPFMRTP
jgi:N-acetylmuramoyl-L-alanine amidase